MDITRVEVKILRAVLKGETSAEDLSRLVGSDIVDDAVQSLEKAKLIEPRAIEVDRYGDVHKYGGFIPSNRFMCKKALSLYYRDLLRTWYPHIIATLALLASLAAVVISLYALST